MIIRLKIRPNSSEGKIMEKENIAYVKSPAEKNKANIELIKIVAKHYKVSSSQVKIIRGLSSKEKVIEIMI